jgi:hypothetical protein
LDSRLRRKQLYGDNQQHQDDDTETILRDENDAASHRRANEEFESAIASVLVDEEEHERAFNMADEQMRQANNVQQYSTSILQPTVLDELFHQYTPTGVKDTLDTANVILHNIGQPTLFVVQQPTLDVIMEERELDPPSYDEAVAGVATRNTTTSCTGQNRMDMVGGVVDDRATDLYTDHAIEDEHSQQPVPFIIQPLREDELSAEGSYDMATVGTGAERFANRIALKFA